MSKLRDSFHNKFIEFLELGVSDLRIIPLSVVKCTILTSLFNLAFYLVIWLVWLRPASSDVVRSFEWYILEPFLMETFVWAGLFNWSRIGKKHIKSGFPDSWLNAIVGSILYTTEFCILAIFYKSFTFSAIYFAAAVIMCAMHSSRKWSVCGGILGVAGSIWFLSVVCDKYAYKLEIPHAADVVYGMHTMLSICLLLAIIVVIRMNDNERNYKLLAQTRAKSDFLANMSHEIRTPINAIMGMDEMILREDVNKDVEGYALNIQKAGENLLSIINGILDFSKIEAGKTEVVEVEYFLYSVINDSFQITADRAQSSNIELKVVCNPNLPSKLFGDEQKIRQIIINLVTNGIKYTKEGSVTLDIDGEGAEDRFKLKVSVTDTGIGISPKDIDKLFTSFQRVDMKKNRSIEGTGLGLAISKNYIELMGGKLSVDSKVGEGSVFSFEIPQKVVGTEMIGNVSLQKGKTRESKPVYTRAFDAPDKTILVVDDVSINLKVIKGLLKQTRLVVDTAESGKEALELASEKHYDLILLDHMMPEMDGVETLDKLRKMDTPNNDTPVIALTANAINGAKEEYLSSGFSDYMSKPVQGKLLEEMIKKYIYR